MKKCPFCAEEIQSEAIKCRYCGEWLDTKPITDVGVQQASQETLRGQDDSQHEEAPQQAEEPPPVPSHVSAVKKKTIDWYLEVLKKYAVFSGRARRKEYWMFFLYNLIIGIALGFIDGIAGITPPQIKYSLLAAIFSLIVFIPNIAVGVRRMHDTGRSGWWFLLPIVNLVFSVQDSQPDDNQYGQNPKALTDKHSTDFTSLVIIVVCLSVIGAAAVYTLKVMEIRRDGRFIAYNNGTVLDKRTNLMWAAKDNGSNINWADAKSYCENYRGGGYTDWRMPTQDELAGLYDTAKTYKSDCGYDVHLTELIRRTCNWAWASEPRGSSFSFHFGNRFWNPPWDDSASRALPVRYAK